MPGSLDEAEQLYRRILELHRTDRQARYSIGVIRLQQGRAAEALGFLEPLAAEAPRTDLVCRYPQPARPGAAGRWGAARRPWPISTRRLATQARQCHGLALSRQSVGASLGRFHAALENYERLLRIAPGYDEAWFRRGATLWRMERLDEALASFRQRAGAAIPAAFSAAFNSGTVLLKLERYDEAFAAFEKARSLGAGPSLCAGRHWPARCWAAAIWRAGRTARRR